MAKEQITGLLLSDDLLEWATLQAGKLQDARRLPLERPDPAATEEELAGVVSVEEQVQFGCAGIKSDIALAIPSVHLLTRVLNLPTLDAEELAGTIDLQVDKLSPFPVETMVISHEVLRRDENDMVVLVCAAQERVVLDYAERLRPAGLNFSRVDAAALGWWRVLSDAGDAPQEGRHVTVIIDSAVPEIIVSQDGIPILFRTVTVADAEELPDTLAREVEFSLMTLELDHGVPESRAATIWYRGEEPEAIAHRLRQGCACAVEMRSLDDVPSLAEGVARRAGQPGGCLDLTPPSWREAEEAARFRKLMLTVGGVVLGVWLLFVLAFVGGLTYQGRVLQRLKQEREEWVGPADEVRDIRVRVGVIEAYTDSEHSSLECLREVAAQQPDGVELTSFTYRKGEALKIAGEAVTVEQVYDFKNKLDEAALFLSSRLTGPRFDRRRGKQVFELDLQLPKGEEV